MHLSDSSTPASRQWPASHLRAADIAFAALTCPPAPLSLDCDALPGAEGAGLPGGVVPLPQLRCWLLNRPAAYAARDVVWRELILRARLQGGQWTIAAVGMAMPGLVRMAGRLCVGWHGDSADIDNEVLTGFLEALRHRTDLDRPAPHAALIMAGWRAGRVLRLAQDADVPVEDIERFTAGPRVPDPVYRHPDLLVLRAGMLGVLAAEDVQPWIDIRLGRRAPEPIAAALGISVDALRMRLVRADEHLAVALADGLLSGVVSAQTRRDWQRTDQRRTARRHGAPTAIPDARRAA